MSQETIEPPKMTLTLHRFNTAELKALAAYSQSRIEAGNLTDATFQNWLTGVCRGELKRRAKTGAEPGSIAIPATLRPIELASFLEGAFILSRSVITPAIGAFVDELEKHVICCVSSYLQQLDSCWEQVS